MRPLARAPTEAEALFSSFNGGVRVAIEWLQVQTHQVAMAEKITGMILENKVRTRCPPSWIVVRSWLDRGCGSISCSDLYSHSASGVDHSASLPRLPPC